MLSLWGIYFAYKACKRIWQERLAPDATLNTTLQSYRSELEKRRDYARHVWRKAGLTFVFAGMALIVVPSLIKSLGTPAAPVELRAIVCASRDMVRNILSHEEAKSAEASTGNRGAAGV
ncbi:MAG: hypothetical protein WB781_03495 [Candidatus Sulfotelmatobacter sp.]